MKTGAIFAGGGFYGIGACAVLANLERDLNQTSVSYCFDFFAGTSVGSMIAGMLAIGLTADKILGLFLLNLKPIFGNERWAYKLAKMGSRFDDSYVNSLLKTIFGTTTMDQLRKPTFIYAWNATTQDLKVFSCADVGVPLWYAVRCSMAAPTYFPPIDGIYMDGGMAANNPAPHTVAALKECLGVPYDEIRMIDFVTSGLNPPKSKCDPNAFILTTLNRDIIPALTSGNSSDSIYIAKSMVGASNVFEIRPACANYDMAQTEKAPEIEAVWRGWYDQNKAPLLRWISGI